MTTATELYYEGFDEWRRARQKTHRDMNYWGDDELQAAEIAWCDAWDNAEKWAGEEMKKLNARIKKLEEECAWLNSVGTAGGRQSPPSMSYGYRVGPCSAHGLSGDSTDE